MAIDTAREILNLPQQPKLLSKSDTMCSIETSDVYLVNESSKLESVNRVYEIGEKVPFIVGSPSLEQIGTCKIIFPIHFGSVSVLIPKPSIYTWTSFFDYFCYMSIHFTLVT